MFKGIDLEPITNKVYIKFIKKNIIIGCWLRSWRRFYLN